MFRCQVIFLEISGPPPDSPNSCLLLVIWLDFLRNFFKSISTLLYRFRSSMDTIWTPNWTGLGEAIQDNLRGLSIIRK